MKANPTLSERTLSSTITTPSGGIMPAYVRMPLPGAACPITQMKRGALYELASAGKIKTCTIRRKGSMRGIRLIHVESLLAFIAQCQDSPEEMEREEIIES